MAKDTGPVVIKTDRMTITITPEFVNPDIPNAFTELYAASLAILKAENNCSEAGTTSDMARAFPRFEKAISGCKELLK